MEFSPKGINRLPGGTDPEMAAAAAIGMGLDEFFVSESFDPGWTASLIRSGFLPMAGSFGADELLLPKLHRERCILDWDAMRITDSARRASRRFRLAVDSDFPGAMEGCVSTHGEDWLSRRLRDLFLELYLRPPEGSVRFHSFELYPADTPVAPDAGGEELCAAEIGYSCGKSYTSLSGFHRVDSAGTVQLAATGALLALSGAAWWDLGMTMDYKLALGARGMDRAAFVSRLKASRDSGPLELRTDLPMAARRLIDEFIGRRR